MINTYQKLELNNGSTINLTLNLKRLLLLKSKHPDLYKEVNSVIIKGAEDLFEFIKVIYVAYLCALESGAEEMSFDTFLDVIPQEFNVLATITANLINPKKK